MSGSLAQVIAHLTSAIEQLDASAVRATRAATDAAEANAIYTRVGTGTGHPKLRAAVLQSRVGTDKAHRLARLSSEAARNITAYLNTIAPGSVPQPAATSGPPTGEDLLADSDRRDLARDRMREVLTRATRKADELQERSAEAVESSQKLLKFLRDPDGSSRTQSTGTGTPVVSSPAPRPKIEAAEAAGNLVVVSLLAGMGARWFMIAASKMIARLRK